MGNVPSVIKIAGKAKRANLSGNTIERKEKIFVESERGWFSILDTQDHFCYKQNQFIGPSLVCTCGSIANIYGYEAYSQFQSTNMGRVVACMRLIETRRHADGTSG